MSVSTGKGRRAEQGRKAGRRALGLVMMVSILLVSVSVGQAEAQGPPPVEGPWLNMDQIICFTNPSCTNEDTLDGGVDFEYNSYYGQSFQYGADRRRQCYYQGADGPEAHDVNKLYLMMGCRVGMVIGGIAWIGTGIGLMALGWMAFRRSIESLSTGGGGASALRAAIDVPIGILIMFMAPPLGLLIYGVARYNFLRYLNPDVWP